MVSGPQHKVEASRRPEGPRLTGVPEDPGPGSPAESGTSPVQPAPALQVFGLREPQVGGGESVVCVCARVGGVAEGEAMPRRGLPRAC